MLTATVQWPNGMSPALASPLSGMEGNFQQEYAVMVCGLKSYMQKSLVNNCYSYGTI
jgi:hypothetical protein